ncbi:hypothetical protein F157LOC_00773 [Pectobacterium brasiliense]|uniref:putative phage abortive infection protein n=1 Tax=Pectobacterium brasiliense TaxID=180957 RepID=UPI000CE69685|nr:putative phage abortive infection protein [Pectobacterium brasiliense]PPE61939.1 hypothetical protein F157LOC_00773 [Pectobacterium brasiliense]
MGNTIFNASNIINFFVALGTCAAVIVALFAKKQSSFEATFALLLAQHNEALKNLKNSQDFKEKTHNILNGYNSLNMQNIELHKNDDFYGSYFRILYHLLKFIDANAGYHRFDLGRKKTYTSLVRSHLDNEITFLLAINCAHANKNNQYYNFKEIIEKYAMLEHLILDRIQLTKYVPTYVAQSQVKYRNTRLLSDGTLHTIFDDIVANYKHSAFGTNPLLENYK